MLLQKEEPKVNFTGDISLREERNKFRMRSGCQSKKGVMLKYKQNTYVIKVHTVIRRTLF